MRYELGCWSRVRDVYYRQDQVVIYFRLLLPLLLSSMESLITTQFAVILHLIYLNLSH